MMHLDVTMYEAYLYSSTQDIHTAFNCVNYSIITPIMYLRMPIFRVWSADRTIKKTVVSTPEIEALKKKGKENNA